jgi:hypothetical protein
MSFEIIFQNCQNKHKERKEERMHLKNVSVLNNLYVLSKTVLPLQCVEDLGKDIRQYGDIVKVNVLICLKSYLSLTTKCER